MENYKKICGRVSCIITIFFTFVAIICTIVMIYLVHLGKLLDKIGLLSFLTLCYTGGGHNDYPQATLKLCSTNRKVWFGPIFL